VLLLFWQIEAGWRWPVILPVISNHFCRSSWTPRIVPELILVATSSALTRVNCALKQTYRSVVFVPQSCIIVPWICDSNCNWDRIILEPTRRKVHSVEMQSAPPYTTSSAWINIGNDKRSSTYFAQQTGCIIGYNAFSKQTKQSVVFIMFVRDRNEKHTEFLSQI